MQDKQKANSTKYHEITIRANAFKNNATSPSIVFKLREIIYSLVLV
jgi:hypothetical protein